MMDNGTGSTEEGASLADLLGAAGGTLAGFGARAADVLGLGLDSLVQLKPDIRLLETGVVEYDAVVAELEGSDYMTIEMRFALSESEAYPIAVIAPFDDLGRVLKMSISAAEMADDSFARGQVEMLTQSVRELLDLSGLMLFIDGLAGGEATVTTVRVRDIEQTVGVLQATEQASLLARVAFALNLPGQDETRLALLVPGVLLARLDAVLTPAVEPADEPYEEPYRLDIPDLQDVAAMAPPPVMPMGSNPLAEMLPPLRAVAGGSGMDELEPDNISPLHSIGGGRVTEPEVSVHPVRFPPLTMPEASSVPQQQMDLILDVPLRVSVELGRSSMTVESVLALGPGSVVELNKLAGEPVDVLVNDRLIARGEVVVVDENFGVRVTEVISPRSRANAISR